MKVSLISPYPDITNYGLRSISATLRAAGHSTQVICMPDFAGDGESVHVRMSEDRYSEQVIDQMLELVSKSDLVGVTLMTHYYDSARQITKAIQTKLGIPVIWGGFHPSVRPDECARQAEYVAIGDAEDLMLQLCEHLENGDANKLHGIKSLVWRKGQDVIRNAPGSVEASSTCLSTRSNSGARPSLWSPSGFRLIQPLRPEP